jgi:hypothetical protein
MFRFSGLVSTYWALAAAGFALFFGTSTAAATAAAQMAAVMGSSSAFG